MKVARVASKSQLRFLIFELLTSGLHDMYESLVSGDNHLIDNNSLL